MSDVIEVELIIGIGPIILISPSLLPRENLTIIPQYHLLGGTFFRVNTMPAQQMDTSFRSNGSRGAGMALPIPLTPPHRRSPNSPPSFGIIVGNTRRNRKHTGTKSTGLPLLFLPHHQAQCPSRSRVALRLPTAHRLRLSLAHGSFLRKRHARGARQCAGNV